MSRSMETNQDMVRRHSILEIMEHWAVALSGLVLVATGLFELPVATRYYITDLPGMAWAGDFFFSLQIHYAASAVFVTAALFHVVYHSLHGHTGMFPKRGDLKSSVDVVKCFFGQGEEPPFHKYLPEQRLAYAGMAFVIAGLIISGLIKTYKNIYSPDMSVTLVTWATWVHNIFFILFALAFIVHMTAIAIKPNRPLVRSIFTGHIRLDYAQSRHPLWMEEIRPQGGKGVLPGEEGPAVQENRTACSGCASGNDFVKDGSDKES